MDSHSQYMYFRFTFCNLTFHDVDFGVKADWSFAESYHGKGPHDGIGGTVKRNVWTAVLKGHINVQDARSFYEVTSFVVLKARMMLS